MNRRILDRFLGDEKGAVTVEFTVLVPVFIMMFFFFADASVVWLTHSEMYNAARDLSRKMAVGEIEPAEAKNYADQTLFLSGRTYRLDAREIDGDMRVAIAVPVERAAMFGVWFKPVLGKNLVATAVTRTEPKL